MHYLYYSLYLRNYLYLKQLDVSSMSVISFYACSPFTQQHMFICISIFRAHHDVDNRIDAGRQID